MASHDGYIGEGWTSTNIPLRNHAAATSSLLLSHQSNFKAASSSDAAYVLSLFGSCAPSHRLNLLTAATLLLRTQPIFPVVAMLGNRCWTTQPLRRQLDRLGVVTVHTPEVSGVQCTGRRFGPDSKALDVNATSSYFDATYTILAAWDLVKYRAVLVLDSDLAVRRSLDHVLLAMLARPEIAEARTPEGCLDAVSVQPTRGNYFNTGVWGVRPDHGVYEAVIDFLQSGSREHQCGIGIQTAAKGFFSKGRIDPTRFDARRDCCPDWRSMRKEQQQQSQQQQQSGKASSSANSNSNRRVLLRPWEILQLHAGYNMKANQGVANCLRKHGQPANESFVVHWSGSRKPTGLRPHATLDHLERAAHADYMGAYCNLWHQHYTAEVPEGVESCKGPQADYANWKPSRPLTAEERRHLKIDG